MKRTLPILSLAVMLLTGCSSIPSTEISIPKYGTITSPKQIELENLLIKTSDGVQVSIGKIRSVNDSAVIHSVSQANVDMIRETGTLVDKVKAATQSGPALMPR